MTAPRFAPQPQRRHQPRRQAPAPTLPPYLRVVRPGEAGERRLTRLLTVALVAAACAGLFAIVALRVLLAQGQVEIDRLEASVDAARARQQSLRLTVAGLEAPAQVVTAAHQRLGMVTPPTVTYLNPPPASAP